MDNIGIDEKTNHSTKGTTDQNTWEEDASWNRGPIREHSIEIPYSEVNNQGFIVENSFLVHEGLDDATFWIQQKSC